MKVRGELSGFSRSLSHTGFVYILWDGRRLH